MPSELYVIHHQYCDHPQQDRVAGIYDSIEAILSDSLAVEALRRDACWISAYPVNAYRPHGVNPKSVSIASILARVDQSSRAAAFAAGLHSSRFDCIKSLTEDLGVIFTTDPSKPGVITIEAEADVLAVARECFEPCRYLGELTIYKVRNA